jgi:signal transduction histidine kinase
MIIASRNPHRIDGSAAARKPYVLADSQEHVNGIHPPDVRLRDRLARLRRTLPGPGLEVAVALGLLALAASAFIPATRLELRTSGDEVAFETTATLISTIAALLFFDRFWHHLRRRDLLLAGGLAVNAASNLGAGLLLANDVEIGGHTVAWVVLGGRLAAWGVIATAALTSDRVIARPSNTTTRTAVRCAAAFGVLSILVVLLSAHSVGPEGGEGGPLGSATAMLPVQILLVALTSASALALHRESRRERDSTTRLLTLACAFAATAALANCADPSFYGSHEGVGDVLRLGWLATLFASVCVEWSLDERRAARNALARERRRMAADVHDLIMQDLSFALANARALSDDPADPASAGDQARATHADTVVSAGERALAGARNVVSALDGYDTRPIAQTIEANVRAAARHTPLRFDAARVSSSARADEPTREALVHIAREAVTNAVKHARANAIEVVLEHADQWRLTVRDDGRGFNEVPATNATVGGFGLVSMRECAHLLGGAVHVGSTTGAGTTVEAVLP